MVADWQPLGYEDMYSLQSRVFDTMMKKFALILVIGSFLVGCAVYAPAPGPAPASKGGPGNNYCPPGQAKKGNC